MQFVAIHNLRICQLLYLLDDLLALDEPNADGFMLTNKFFICFDHLQISLNVKKTERHTKCLHYLGIKLDTIALEASFPKEKISGYNKTSCKVNQLHHFVSLTCDCNEDIFIVKACYHGGMGCQFSMTVMRFLLMTLLCLQTTFVLCVVFGLLSAQG